MRRATVVLLAVVVASSCACAQNLVRNYDFSAAPADMQDLAEDWVLPDGWQRLPDAGPDGSAILRCTAPTEMIEPARQWLAYARPDGAYALTVVARRDGAVAPLVRVIDRETGEEIAALTLDAGDTWSEQTTEFVTPTANLGVELYADAHHADGAAGPAGTAEFASVKVTPVAGGADRPGPADAENLALGRPYEIPRGTYGLCTDPDDATQLTDGEYTEGYFWTEDTTVGWRSTGPEFITIDLGADRPISGVGYSTAAGVAGVTWPSKIDVFVSATGEQWHRVGDLVEMHTDREPLPAIGDYNTRMIWTDELDTHGQFVKLAVYTEGNYIFVDEVEVYRGPDELLDTPYESEPIADIELYTLNQPIFDLHRQNLAEVREDIADLPADRRANFEERAGELARAIDNMAPVELEGFRAILPLSDVHERIFTLQAEVWLTQGKDRLRLWQNHRWDHLEPSEEPPSDTPPALDIEMMRNETRADVLNITSANPRSTRVQLRITGLPGGDSPDWITVRQVEHVGSKFIPSVASPLPVAERDGDWWTVEVPAGMTRQVWFEVDSSDLDAGIWAGEVLLRSVAAGRQSVPFRLQVHPLTMPDEKTLYTGGWSYTDWEKSRGLTPGNRDKLVAHLRARDVNAPWATGAALPSGEFDAEGNMTAEPDTAHLDAWIDRWPGAKIYLVFAAVRSEFAGASMGSERFDRQVGQWAQFWTNHMTELGLRPDQLGVLLVDEPRSVEQYETITAWARAIEAAAPGMVIWEDPFIIDDREPMLEMFELTDVLCPNRVHYIHDEGPWREIIQEQREHGRELWFYSCSGPARTFGPYSYYLAQAWHAFEIGARGSNFWAFADLGGVSAWCDYLADSAGSYSPVFVDDTSVTAAKPMEAIRESLQDFEYLVMLQERVERMAAAGVPERRLAQARRLLDHGPERVLGDRPGEFNWEMRRDRTAQDDVRREVLQQLLELGKQMP
jgi:hypothetical protein